MIPTHVSNVYDRLHRRVKSIRYSRPRVAMASIGVSLLLCILALGVSLRAPAAFPTHTPIEIETGTSLREALLSLEEQQVVHSPLLLQIFMTVRYPGEDLKAGTYVFGEPMGVPSIARALALGTHNTPPIVLTIHEGFRVDQIDELAAAELDGVEAGEITLLAKEREGYLFPDTYFIPHDYTAEAFVDLLSVTFEEKIATVTDEIANSPYSLEEIITMASILEREANTEESMRTVAGILWKRLDAGMPLQVDAAFEYVLEKSSAELTFDDLEVDSPYNTYRNVGLPPTPIANPGLLAIQAALDPIPSPYWFYLTGRDGLFYYAEDFDGHRQNRARYLD